MSEAPALKYNKKYREYAAEYGVSEVTIKRWAKAKYPMDEPEKMPEKLGLQRSTSPALQTKTKAELQEEKLREEIEKLRLGNAVAKREYTPNTQIREDLTRIATALRGELMRMENDLPGVLAGLESSQIQKIIKGYNDKLIEHLHDSTSSLYPPIAEAIPPCHPSP